MQFPIVCYLLLETSRRVDICWKSSGHCMQRSPISYSWRTHIVPCRCMHTDPVIFPRRRLLLFSRETDDNDWMKTLENPFHGLSWFVTTRWSNRIVLKSEGEEFWKHIYSAVIRHEKYAHFMLSSFRMRLPLAKRSPIETNDEPV